MKRQRRSLENYLSFLVIVAVIVVGAYFLYPPSERIKLGLDLQGGVEVLLQAALPPGVTTEESQDTIGRIITILENRVNEFGLANVVITPLGSDRILVQLPGTQNTSEARSLIGQTALLEFKRVVRVGTSPNDTLSTSSPLEQALRDREGLSYIVEADPQLTGAALADARMQVNATRDLTTLGQGERYVALRFTDEGGREFTRMINDLTTNDHLAIVLDGVIQSAPSITQSIKDAARTQGTITNATIQGSFSVSEAQQLAIVLRAGALPADISIIQELTIGPTLGRDAIERGQNTILIGFVLVLIYMLFSYRAWGVVADFALLLNMLIVFGAMSIYGAALTLPGIAGLLLTIGMSVDANVIIFERIIEERKAGKTPHAALRDGFKKSLSTVLDANITTLATALILFTVGTGPIKGFSVTLSLGILGSLFCALFVTRYLLEATGLGHRVPGVGRGKTDGLAQVS